MLKDLKITDVDRRGRVSYSFNPNDPLVTGQQRLVQQIVKFLFTLRGTNLFRPEEGSTFLHLMAAVDDSQIDTVKSSLPLTIETVKDQILDIQADQLEDGVGLADEETLVDLKMKHIEFDPVFGGWIIDLQVKTLANELNITI